MLDRNGQIPLGVFCSSCNYELKGLKPGGGCPECGRLISESLEEARVRALPCAPKAEAAMSFAVMGLIVPPMGVVAMFIARAAVNQIDRNADELHIAVHLAYPIDTVKPRHA